MTYQGTLANLNAALDGVRYDPALNYSGSDALTVTTNDLGNTGSGGALSATNSAFISVAFVNSAPVLTGANDLSAIDEDRRATRARWSRR